jgi:hypothetical protein
MTYFYTTDIGTYEGETAFFVGINELLDHLQNVYQCTADELEFSKAWKHGELFEEHVGTISNEFSKSWNENRVDDDKRRDIETLNE